MTDAAIPFETVTVPLGERSYDILIGDGALAAIGPRIAALYPGSRCVVVTDGRVARLHLDALEAALRASGVDSFASIVPAGERSKSWHGLTTVVDSILGGRLERRDIVIALGGGVIGDLAGFAAAISRRGMDFVQVPTTLLAQVDSSVGGKTGINTEFGKNLVGAFHQPGLVIADTTVLDTLSERHMRAGYAEIAKYGLIDDAAFFSWLEENWTGVFAGGDARRHAIATSCRAKARVVAADEREAGQRALLNLGHTFGHALEAATSYDETRLVHGEGVAIGMAQAFRFSARLGFTETATAERVEAHLLAVGLPTRLADIDGDLPTPEGLAGLMAQDKKVSRGRLTFILARGIGQSFIETGVDAEVLKSFLAEEAALPALATA
ncbi:MAG: 3-dehydroquinate synthase [Hyphomicrobiaceae bacterium]|nr:3-dehydroquinate synthase [Hyphomicrobiaceae bacterium]